MKKFDMTRFGRVLKLDFSEGFKPMMWGTLCMLLLYLFFFWFAHDLGFNESSFQYMKAMDHLTEDEIMQLRIKEICSAVSAFSAMAMYIFFLIAASTLYRGEQKKQRRIAWLMLPATNLEKFVSRWVYLLVFSLVGGLLTFFVADLLHMAYLSMAGYPVMASTDELFSVLPSVTARGWLRTLPTYAFLTGIHAIYLLGGVFFKKFHFIAVSAAVVFGFTSFVALMNMLFEPGQPASISNNALYIIITVCWTLVTILCTWLAYRLFCRWQVVTHKLANV